MVPPFHAWVAQHVPPLDALLIGISGLGSGWFVALGFGVAGLVALSRRRTDLALLLAAGTLAFPIEWALKYFTADPRDQPGAALERALQRRRASASTTSPTSRPATPCAPRSSTGCSPSAWRGSARRRRQGMTAYVVAIVLIGAISLIRLYLEAHYPMDLLGGWMAGGALLAVLVAVYSLAVDGRVRA